MGVETTEQEVASWQAQGVSVSHIERELSALWRPGLDDLDGGRSLATRTSVLNLVVYTEGEAAAEWAEETIAQLAASHPSRALIVAAEPHSAEASLDATLSAHCHIARAASSTFCCEQVTITARGAAARHVAGVVSPLLLPDLPVMVWWQAAAPPAGPLFARMVEAADRLILDAATFGSGPAALQQVVALRAVVPSGCALADLAWTRLRPWRELLAGLFDEAVYRPFVRGIRSLVITYKSASGAGVSGDLVDTPPSIPLFIGWVAAASGQQPVILIRHEPVEGVAEGDVLGIELDAARDGRELRAVLRRDPAAPAAVVQRVWLDAAPPRERRHDLGIEDEGILLARELEGYGDDPLYLAALEYAAAEAGPLGGFEGQHEER